MSRKKTKRRRKTNRKISIATVFGIAAGVMRKAPSGRNLVDDITKGDFNAFAYDAREIFAGIDNNGHFRWDWLVQTYGPMVAGAMISKVVGGKLGVNRHLERIPYIKI